MEYYGIFSPVLGIRQDIPNIILDEAHLSDAENVQMRWGEIHRAKMRNYAFKTAGGVNQAMPDANPVLKYYWFKTTDGSTYLFAFTKDHIYRWNSASTISAATFTTGGGSLDDMTSGGTFTLDPPVATYYQVKIDTAATPDKFSWSDDGGVSWKATGVSITGAAQTLNNGVTVTFGATTGHTVNDRWDFYAGTNWATVFTTALACTYWSVCSYNGAVIATNNVDKVIYSTGAAFAVLGGASGLKYATVGETSYYMTACKFVTTFEGYLWFLNTTENSVSCPNQGRWSALWAVPSATMTIDSGDAYSIEFDWYQHITGVGHYRDFLIVFREKLFHRIWLSTDEFIFGQSIMNETIGCKAPDSIVNGQDGALYFFATDFSVREIQRGEVSQKIDPRVKNVEPSVLPHIRSVWIDEYGEIWWAIPHGGGATANNEIICFRPDKEVWTKREIAVSAFGSYERGGSSITWETIPLEYYDWDHWDWESWDSTEISTEYPIDICADFSGYNYHLHDSSQDADAAFTGYAVLATDLTQHQGMNRYKRLLAVEPYFRDESLGTATISIKADNDTSFTELGDVSLSNTEEIFSTIVPCDVKCKSLELKVSGANSFRFLGVIFHYVWSGVR